ncbi:MAG: sensor histidine kinase [Phycisphaerales bacterium]
MIETSIQPAAEPTLSPSDLAELMASFNEVTSKLEQTHAQLRGEVRRLSAELREANEALQRSKRLSALGEMAAGIAHEVRNPLGSIGLYARMLEEDLGDRPECQGVATKISGAVRGLNAVVGDVLTFSRELRLRPLPTSSVELLRRASELCVAEGCRIEFETEHDVALECDESLIHQALVNVIRNACEANRVAGGGVVRLGVLAQAVDVDDEDPIPGVVLSVRDQGDGFSAEGIDRVFNPFFTTREAGTGLGLPIVHRIIDAHGGRVAVFNNSDIANGATGATVQLRLPLRVSLVNAGVVVRTGPTTKQEIGQATMPALQESR